MAEIANRQCCSQFFYQSLVRRYLTIGPERDVVASIRQKATDKLMNNVGYLPPQTSLMGTT
ncbi:MAG: hypothetical protein GY789_29310 [Hyphomicrobiales bacterium]|nr:hypothetical protein [Hyphomicrobiales bacterium]